LKGTGVAPISSSEDIASSISFDFPQYGLLPSQCIIAQT
jgi:hypothetical protein